MLPSDRLAARLIDKLHRPAWQVALGLVAFAVVGCGSVLLVRRDSNWDLLNYHFYNPWALLHGRVGYDLAPAQLQSYYNPLLDLPFYGMVAAGWPARLIAVLMSLPAAIGAVFLVKLLLRLFAPAPPSLRLYMVGAAALLGVTAAAPVSMLASTMNDWPGAMLFMIALWLLVPSTSHPRSMRQVVWAGLVIGAACGLKLNLVPFAIGAIVATRFADWREHRGFTDTGVLVAAMAAGLFLTSGWWMWKMQAMFGSPLFPLFNDILRSPWFDAVPLTTRVFGPQSLAEWPLFPLRFATVTTWLVTEPPFRDLRWPIAYLLALAAGTAWLWRRFATGEGQRGARDIEPSESRIVDPSSARFVLAFVGVSFVIWAMLFSILRYLVTLELLVGAVIVVLLARLVGRTSLPASIAVVAIIALAGVKYPGWGHLPFDGPYIDGKVPPLAEGTLVLLTNAEPIAYIAPFFPAKARFVGLDNNLNNPTRRNAMQDAIARAIADQTGPIVAIAYPAGRDMGALDAYGLARTGAPCQTITSNMTNQPIDMCPVQRNRGSEAKR